MDFLNKGLGYLHLEHIYWLYLFASYLVLQLTLSSDGTVMLQWICYISFHHQVMVH